MTASLLLLAVFLFLFLKKTYAGEVADLQKEAGYIFVNSIRGTEGKMFEKLLFDNAGRFPDSSIQSWIGKHEGGMSDSTMVFAIVDDKRAAISKDTSFEITIRSTGNENISDIKGSLSVMIAMEDGKFTADSILLKNKAEDLLLHLQKDFSKNMDMAHLPVQYKVIKMGSDTSGYLDLMGAGTYTDTASGEKYGVRLAGFNAYILKKMTPEILFSIGLFAIVSLAFFTVFNNLEAQRKLTELKNDFIQNVTHELKTPIATVGVAIEALQEFDALENPARTQEYLDISKNELGRLSLLVDKVLRMSLFEKTEPELKLEQVDFDSLIQGVLNSMKIQFEKKKATVSFNKKGAGFIINADRLHLTSVVYNLLDNALKYSVKNPKIDLQLLIENKQAILKVTDNGIGIPFEFKDKIFDKFFRVPTGDRHNVKGHGLGLSYVASVVHKHGGKIEMESTENIGTVFKISLPADG